jgi:hypothetical protein
MTAQPLPVRPDLDQLKRQAKELLKAYRAGDPAARQRWSTRASEDAAAREPVHARLRDAQRVIARAYGFPSWDALRTHVEAIVGSGPSSTPDSEARPRRGLVYDDPARPADGIILRGPFTRDEAQRLAEQGLREVKVDASVPPEALVHLAAVPTLGLIDLSRRSDLADRDLAFLEATWSTSAVRPNVGTMACGSPCRHRLIRGGSAR